MKDTGSFKYHGDTISWQLGGFKNATQLVKIKINDGEWLRLKYIENPIYTNEVKELVKEYYREIGK
jgi:hypothetical protein